MIVSDLGGSERTTVLCIYELTPPVHPCPPREELTRHFDLGRFRRHVEAAAQLLPGVVYATDVAPATLAGHDSASLRVAELRLLLLATPRGDLLLLLRAALPGEPTAGNVAAFLGETCFQREAMTLDGRPLTQWLADRVAVPPTLQFGRNVHQCVFPGGALREDILVAAARNSVPSSVASIVYRATMGADKAGQLRIRQPAAVNATGDTLLAHGRGVSVLAGWSAPAEMTLALAAVTNVSALGVLHRVRAAAFDALLTNQRARLSSAAQARELVSELSTQMNEVQLDLSFGVEAYVDSILIPELVFDSFQTSLCEATGLETALANTSRMVERLNSVINARAAVLEAEVQDQTERRDRLFNWLLAAISLIALPPALLLAFFGANSVDVDESRSILDLERYWVAYLVTWIPFLAVLALAYLLRRRIRRQSRHLSRGRAGEAPDHQAEQT